MDLRPHLRPATPADESFLFELYARVHEPEVAAWGWPAAQRQAFLRTQWLAQQRHYEAYYPAEGHCLLELEGRSIGRMWVVRSEHEVHLVDMALLPEYQGRGLGTALLRALQHEASTQGKPLRLRVTRSNRALRLYTRLGFAPAGEASADPASPYLSLEWRPSGPHSKPGAT